MTTLCSSFHVGIRLDVRAAAQTVGLVLETGATRSLPSQAFTLQPRPPGAPASIQQDRDGLSSTLRISRASR